MKIDYIIKSIFKSGSLLANQPELLNHIRTDEWKVTKVNKYPSVNGGAPVIDLESLADSKWWLNNIPLDWFKIEEVIDDVLSRQK